MYKRCNMAERRGNLQTGEDHCMIGDITDTYGGQVTREMPNPTASFDGPSSENYSIPAPVVLTEFLQISSPVGSSEGRLSTAQFMGPLNDCANSSRPSGGFVPPNITPQRSYPQHTVGVSQPPTSLFTRGVFNTGAPVTPPTFPLPGSSELQDHVTGSTNVIRSLLFSPVSRSSQSTWTQSSQLTESGARTESNNSLQEQEPEEHDRITGHSYDLRDHDTYVSSDSYNKGQGGMCELNDDSTDLDSGASSDGIDDILCYDCYKKANYVCLDCCYRLSIKLCRKCSKDRHPGKLEDIHHRITLSSQATSQRVSYTQGDGEHNSSHLFTNRRYVCWDINFRESCEGEATTACLDCLVRRISCSTCDVSVHTGDEANHRRIHLHPVSTDDARGGGSPATGSDGDGECGDSTSRMISQCDRCPDEAVEACLDCALGGCFMSCADCDIKRHTQKLITTHCRIPVERFQQVKERKIGATEEILTEMFEVPNDTFYVCKNPMRTSNTCEGKATYVVSEYNLFKPNILCKYCYKQKMVEHSTDYRVVMLHYQKSVPNVEHGNISMQQDNDETNLENTNETTPEIAMKHQIRTTDTLRNTDETTQNHVIDQDSDNSIVTADLGTTTGQNSDKSIVRENLDTTQVSSQHESSTVAPGNDEEIARNSSDDADSDHAEGSHYKCDRCDGPAHSVFMDCDRNLNRLCQQCYKTEDT